MDTPFKPSEPRRRNLQPMIYTFAALAMVLAVFNHLYIGSDAGLEEVGWQDVIEAWPSWGSILSVPVFLFGAALSAARPRRAAQAALVASLLTSPYFLFSACIFSLLLFLTPKGIAFFVLPGAMVLVAFIYSVRILRAGR